MIRLVIAAAALVSVELPNDFVPFADMPGGPSADAVNANCLSCHSGEMVLNQPHLTRIEWAATVTKMRATYKAPIDAADDAAILDWLVAMQASRNEIQRPKG